MRALPYILAFFIVAGLFHIGSIFALPALSRNDVFTRLESGVPLNALAVIDSADLRSFPFADPAFAIAVCRFDLEAGPTRIRIPLSETFLAIVFAEKSRGVFSSVSDRAATRGVLDVVLASPAQLERIAHLDDEEQGIEEIRIASPARQGLAILKVFVDRPSSRERAEALLRQAQCESEALPG